MFGGHRTETVSYLVRAPYGHVRAPQRTPHRRPYREKYGHRIRRTAHPPLWHHAIPAAQTNSNSEAYARALGADILNPEGDFPEQMGQTFTRDRFSLKHSVGGGGFRLTAERIPR